MLCFFRALVVSTYCVALTCAVKPAFAAENSGDTRLHLESVTGLPDFDCSSKNSTSASIKCDSVMFEVQVFPIEQVDGAVVACVAYFPYSKLTVHTTKDGEAVVLTWHISTAGASFSGNGISIKEDFQDAFADLFDKFSTTAQQAQLFLKSGVKLRKRFNHLPTTSLTGVAKPCDGADPIISNSAD